MPRRRTFQGARCLVTGASSGLGRALAEQLAREGARVVLTGRSTERLRRVVDGLISGGVPPDSLHPIAADLTDPEGRRLLIEATTERLGALDLAINAAGVGAYGHFETHEESVLRRVFEINFFALAEMTRAVLPLLRLGESPALVNLGSIVARRGLPGRPEYSASKFAVAGLTEAVRAEWAKYGIAVLLVNPGFTATAFDENLLIDNAVYKTSHARTMTPDQVAAATLTALRRGRREITLSLPGRLLLLFNRLTPRFVDWGMNRWTLRLYPDAPAHRRNRRQVAPGPGPR